MTIAASSSLKKLEAEFCFCCFLASLLWRSPSSVNSSGIGCVTVASELLTEAESSSARTELNSSPHRYDLTELHLLLSTILFLTWTDNKATSFIIKEQKLAYNSRTINWTSPEKNLVLIQFSQKDGGITTRNSFILWILTKIASKENTRRQKQEAFFSENLEQ